MTSSWERKGREGEKSRGARATLQHGEEEGGAWGEAAGGLWSCRELLYHVEASA
jgi:hypothetical protein